MEWKTIVRSSDKEGGRATRSQERFQIRREERRVFNGIFFCPSSSSSSAAASLIIVTVSLHCAVLCWAGLCCAVSVCRPQLKPYFGYYDDADVIKVIPCVSFTITRARNRMRASTSHTHTQRKKERDRRTWTGKKRGEKILHSSAFLRGARARGPPVSASFPAAAAVVATATAAPTGAAAAAYIIL